jgi:hypothetical protein
MAMGQDYNVMTSAQLVEAYNDMAGQLNSLGKPVTKVKKFETRGKGVERCQKAHEILSSHLGESSDEKIEHNGEQQNGSATNEDEPVPVRTRARKEKKPKVVKAPKAAKPKKASKPEKVEKSEKPVKAKKEKQPKKSEVRSSIVEACGVRGGTNRAKALDHLYSKLGKQATTPSIMAAVYDESEEVNKNAFYTVMKALVRDMTNSKAKYTIKRERDEKGNVSYGLYGEKSEE